MVSEYFLFEIPGEHVVRVRRCNLILQHDRNMHARRYKAFSERVLLNETLNEFGTDAEIIEKRIPLYGCSEAVNAPTLNALTVQIFEVLFLLFQDRGGETAIGFEVICI